jgi:hypothetical protein
LDETGEVTLTPGMKPKSGSSPQKRTRTATPLPSSLDASSSRSVSPDCAPPRTPRKAHPSFALLRKDLDFIPMTPKKASRFGMGTPRTRPGLPGRTPHSVRSGRTSPIDMSDPPTSCALLTANFLTVGGPLEKYAREERDSRRLIGQCRHAHRGCGEIGNMGLRLGMSYSGYYCNALIHFCVVCRTSQTEDARQ